MCLFRLYLFHQCYAYLTSVAGVAEFIAVRGKKLTDNHYLDGFENIHKCLIVREDSTSTFSPVLNSQKVFIDVKH